jgi:hypothetical protein
MKQRCRLLGAGVLWFVVYPWQNDVMAPVF